MNTQRAYLLHALDAIDAVLEYTQDGRDAFFADRKTQDAVIRNIEVLGQAVKSLSAETRAHDGSIPWRQIAGMRDKLIHEYFGVDLALVWDVVERELPSLRPKIGALLQKRSDQLVCGKASWSPRRKPTQHGRRNKRSRRRASGARSRLAQTSSPCGPPVLRGRLKHLLVLTRTS